MASSSSNSWKYDVFLSFSREDDAKIFADHLYSALIRQGISVYMDDETLPHSESIFKAIEELQIAVIVLSKTFADSSWCLDELAHIMKCIHDESDQIVMPVFYDVDPSEVRRQTGGFGESFAKQVAKNGAIKAELWRKALTDVSNIAGWALKNNRKGHEKVIKTIVDRILDNLPPLRSWIDEDIVGMKGRVQELESLLDIGSGGVRMVGIWGMGGIGKTTLAYSLYKKIYKQFHGHYIIENVREESRKIHGLEKLQGKALSAILKHEVHVGNIVEGEDMMERWLCHRKVLVVLDDVDDHDQLEALVGSRDWFGEGSRIIITTRDEHLLHLVADCIYYIRLLSHGEAIQLFKRHAYNEEEPIEGYETLSLRVISYCGGLPLALKVIGSFLYDKDKTEWISALGKLQDTPQPEIMDILKTSYDGLETDEKELFLDIACFFNGWDIADAMEIFAAYGFFPQIGIRVLVQKALISIVDDRLSINDRLQEMGQHIVRRAHPENPEKHSRVWKHEEIRNMCFSDATKENDKIEMLRYDGYSSDHEHSSHFCKIVSKMKKLRFLSKTVCSDSDVDADGPSFLSNKLRYIHWELYPASPFPESFKLMKLVVLKLWGSMQKEIWKGFKHLRCLKVLQLKCMWELVSTPDLNGLPRLQKLTLFSCKELIEIHPSLVNHTNLEYLSISECPKLRLFPPIVPMKYLKTLEIKDCFLGDGEIPNGIGELSNLQELNLSGNDFSRLDFSLSQLTQLKLLDLSYCVMLLELPKLPSNSAILKADYCSSLTTVGDFHSNCERLCQVSLMGGGIINDGGRLLQSMLEGKTTENGSMLLRLKGIGAAKGFTPAMFRGRRCRLQLPDNLFSDSCGFLICAVLPNYFHWSDPARMVISHVTGDMVSEDDVVWEESDDDSDKHTFVWYVSFGSLRETTIWWDQTHKAVEFKIEDYRCCGFGVSLVPKKSRSDLTDTSTYSSNYTPRLKIEDDLESALTISLSVYAPKPKFAT